MRSALVSNFILFFKAFDVVVSSLSRSRTETPVDKMMSSGGPQNVRPASAPGEDAPSADSSDRNEVSGTELLSRHYLDSA